MARRSDLGHYFETQHHFETLAITWHYCKSCYAPWNQAAEESGESANHLPPKVLLVKEWIRRMSENMSSTSPEGSQVSRFCPEADFIHRPAFWQSKQPGQKIMKHEFINMWRPMLIFPCLNLLVSKGMTTHEPWRVASPQTHNLLQLVKTSR